MELALELPSDRFRHEIAARGLESVCLGNTGGRLRRRMVGFRNEAAPDEQVERLIPMKIHADGVKVTNRRKMFVIDVSPAAGDNTSSRFMFAAIASASLCECGCRGFHTLQALFDVLVWDLSRCADNAPPRLRHDNSQFREDEGWRAALEGMPRLAAAYIAGDWEWFKEGFHFRSWQSSRMCFRCEASLEDGPLCYKHVGADAGWRSTAFASTAAVLDRIAAEGVTPGSLVRVPGFSWSMIAIDVLHTWCLGVSQVVLGSFLLEWCREQGLPSQARALLRLNRRYRAFAAVARREDPHFQASPPVTRFSLCPRDQYAGQLAGFKGAETRAMVPFVVALSRDSLRASPHDAHRETRHACVRGLAAFYDSLRAEPFIAESTRNATHTCIVAFAELHAMARAPGAPRPPGWHFIPKVHLAQELGETQVFELGNPRDWWCYRDEAFMGEVKAICHNTRHPRITHCACLSFSRLQKSVCVWLCRACRLCGAASAPSCG
ncbi:MAG: hypothetical protein GY711_26805 [bacterium]|nr:hypothetical protein [bacterium]